MDERGLSFLLQSVLEKEENDQREVVMLEAKPVFTAPSGRKFFRPDVELLRDFHRLGTVVYTEKPYTLNAGGASRIYVNARNELTERVDVLRKVARRILRLAEDLKGAAHDSRQIQFIGVPTAGSALAEAAALESTLHQSLVPRQCVGFRVMRQIRKKHGAHRTWIDGIVDTHQHRYVVVDNVATSSKTLLTAIGRLKSDGYPVQDLDYILLFDRQQGAVEHLTRRGLRVRVLFNLLDVLAFYVHDELWSKAEHDMIAEEIFANQFPRINRRAA